jgi:DivIVA domain-containing protein
MIDLTPLEVRKKKGDFRRIMRGYDPALVDDFLDLVADRLEQLVRENMSLAERTGRQDQQVGEYRERERALTEALVTAQEMREEIRKQTAREADLAKRAAEQEVAQLRATVLQEAKEVRTAAQQEAKQLRTSAQRDAAQIRSQVMLEREREEEAFRRLRGRQEQFLMSYRAFLERELSELTTLARVIGVAPPGGEPDAAGRVAPNVFTPGTVGPGAAAAAFMTARSELAAPSENSPERTPPAAERADTPVSDLDALFAPGDDPELLDLAFVEPVEGAVDLRLTDPFAEAEPFAPEPLLPEDLPPPRPAKPGGRGKKAGAAPAGTDALRTAPVDWADAPGWDTAREPTAASDAGEGEDTSLLLRNAEAAGYRMSDLDRETDDMLLEEELPKPRPASPADEGWLPSLLDDDDR